MVNASELKQILDNKLKPKLLGENFEEINTNAIKLFQKLFVENLNFDLINGQFGEVGEEISTDGWNNVADAEDAYLIAEKDEFRIIYVVVQKLTRYRERSTISSLKRERWAIKGEFFCIFYAENSEIWHIVCPHFTEGRTILRRYVLGEGENHRTISENLTLMDASLLEPLFDRVQEAFKVQVVTKNFYERYKEIFKEIREHVLKQGISISDAKEFTHLLLNRLMFIYFIQKKSWINEDKNFIVNYLRKYRDSGENNTFYSKWLNMLFFKAMSRPISEKSINDFDTEINNILNNIPYLNGGLFEEYHVDKLNFELSDNLLFTIIEDFLEEYNFTITEESPYDVDIAIDPAMLGKIYESLIAEEERGKSGIFYTPRIEVDLMCRLGIYEFIFQDKHKILPRDKNIKKKIIEFIYAPFEELDLNKYREFEFLRKALNSVKIVDPACGSGAFLVGMLQVLIELYMKLGVKIDFNLKEVIIYNSLYGADIKDWAVRMAEFRLWLALIENETNVPNKRPILPNFSFKLQCGDSLIQKIGNLEINIRDYRGKISVNLNNKLNEIQKLKKEYFEGKKEILDNIKKKQIEAIILDLEENNETIKREISRSSQQTLDGKLSKKSRKIVEELKVKIKGNNNIIKKLKNKEDDNYFIWDLNFPEVMLLGGFDIVIANPPYIRQEKIIDQFIPPETLNELSKLEYKQLKDQYKSNLINYVIKTYKIDVGKTCDIYVYFFFKSIELLNSKGVIVYITSNSWLDVKFGKFLQEGLLRNTNLDYIIDNRAKRSFEEADINTIITVLKKKENINYLNSDVKFIAFKKPFEDILNLNTMDNVLISISFKNQKIIKYNRKNIKLQVFDNFRKLYISEIDLWKLGINEEDTKQKNLTDSISNVFIKSNEEYCESKWGIFLKAPDSYFNILELLGEKLTPIKKLGNIQRGYTTGANDFFYLAKPNKVNKYFSSEFNTKNGSLHLFLKNLKDIDKFENFYIDENGPIFKIEKEYWMHETQENSLNLKENFSFTFQDDKGEYWVPNYIVRTPRELQRLVVKPCDLKLVCIKIPKKELSLKPGIKKYINWGNSMKFNLRETCKARKPWYSLGENINKEVICGRIINDRFCFAYNKYAVLVNNSSYVISFKKNKKLRCILLNSSISPLFMELEGRAPYGGGALELSAYEYENLLTFTNKVINDLNNSDKEFLKSIISDYPDLKLDSIFSIYETNDSLNFDLNKMEKVRKSIDKLIFSKIITLNELEKIDFYKSIINLVKERHHKSKSV